MKDFKSHSKFNKQERSGIFFLLLIIMLLQGAYFYIKWSSPKLKSSFELNAEEQHKIDSLRAIRNSNQASKVYPFNPNFITDHKGYALGMSPKEIDRLEAFRAYGKYVNSAEEFQRVTQVSDSLLEVIAPYFVFPDWVKEKQSKTSSVQKRIATVAIKDLNRASADELKQIHGIGDKLSVRIVKFRQHLGGFLVSEQLYDVYGLEPEVVRRALQHYQVLHPPEVKKISVNTASAEELASLVYVRWDLAERIVSFRQVNGGFGSLDELAVVEGFPKEKIERIKLYLSL